jgi:nucleotide-binding universal stress UspA family protein
MKKILVPTDFSQNANNAMIYALELARQTGSQVILLNAYSIPYSGSTVVIDITDILKEEAWKELEKQMDVCRTRYQDVHVTPVAEYGAAADVVAAAVDSYAVDMVVMGTKGAHGLKGAVFGSVTAATAKRSKAPLLAVPEDFEYKKPRKIAFATDFKVNDASHFNVLAAMLKASGAELELINVSADVHAINKDELEAGVKAKMPEVFAGIHSFKYVQDSDVEEGITNHLINNPADMLVTVAHHYGFFERLVHRSIARRLTLHTHIPLLFLHD